MKQGKEKGEWYDGKRGGQGKSPGGRRDEREKEREEAEREWARWEHLQPDRANHSAKWKTYQIHHFSLTQDFTL